MECSLNSRAVRVSDCERCLSRRKAHPVCFRRGFIWGFPDRNEPRWALSLEEAQQRNDDVSIYFDPEWEGNAHLPQKPAGKIKRLSTLCPSHKRV